MNLKIVQREVTTTELTARKGSWHREEFTPGK